MHRIALALALVCALAAPAAAGADPFELYVAEVGKDPGLIAEHLKTCQLIVLPSGEARTPCSLAASDLGVPGATLTAKRVKHTPLPDNSMEYVEADVEARVAGKVVATFRVVELGSSINPDGTYGDFAPVASQWARMMTDADATKLAKAGKLAGPAAIAARDATPRDANDVDRDQYGQGVHDLQQLLTGGDLKDGLAAAASGGVVFGSAPGQRYAGKAGAKQLKGWKLGLRATGGTFVTGDVLALYGATDVVGTLPDKTTITYAALVVYTSHIVDEAEDREWTPRIVSFAVPQ
jgi:hypothetical protein